MKKLVSLLLALMMVLGVMSFAQAEEPFVITAMLPEFPSDLDYVRDDNPILDKIQELTGVRLEIDYRPNSEYDSAMTSALTDDNPPMLLVVTDPAKVINDARAGAFYELTNVVTDAENYPYLAQGNPNFYKYISVDGKLYGIYRGRAFPRGGAYYRTDIAKEVGFDREVKTLADLTELAEKLAAYSDDTYALNMCEYAAGTINYITIAMGAPNTWGVDENGKLYPAHMSPAYKEGLDWLRHLREIGGIDPNFATIPSSEWDNIERTNKAFMRFDCLDNAHRQQEWMEKNSGITEQIFQTIGPVAKEDGSITVWPQSAGYAGEVLIMKKSVKEEDLPKVLKFLDWCNGPEGQTIINAGLQGVTFEVTEEGLRYTPADDQYSKNSQMYFHSINQLGMSVPGNLENPKADVSYGKLTKLRQRYEDLNAELAPYVVMNPCNGYISETYIAFGKNLDTIISDAAVQYIVGMIDEAGLQAAWDEWAMMGGTKITEEYQAIYDAEHK